MPSRGADRSHRRGSPRPIAALVAVGAAACLAGGCGRKMTSEDCQRVADHMREVWAEEAKKAAPESGPAAEKAAAVVKTEGEKLVADWTVECHKELEGRRVDPNEIDCLLAAKTLQEIDRCTQL